MLHVVKGYHPQFRYYPKFYENFTWFNIAAAMAHHPNIQKEIDELSAKGFIEPLMVGAGFYLTLRNLIALCTYLLLRCLL